MFSTTTIYYWNELKLTFETKSCPVVLEYCWIWASSERQKHEVETGFWTPQLCFQRCQQQTLKTEVYSPEFKRTISRQRIQLCISKITAVRLLWLEVEVESWKITDMISRMFQFQFRFTLYNTQGKARNLHCFLQCFFNRLIFKYNLAI